MKIRKFIQPIVIAVFAFLLYSNTLGHKYALDDKAVYWKNEFVQKGISGIKDILAYDSMAGMFGKDSKELEGGRYRPLSLITFALEVEFFGRETTDVAAKQPFWAILELAIFKYFTLHYFFINTLQSAKSLV